MNRRWETKRDKFAIFWDAFLWRKWALNESTDGLEWLWGRKKCRAVLFQKIWNFLPILTFLVPIPLIRPRQTRFCHQKSLFVNFSENLFFWPLGGRFKSGFFDVFSKLGKDIDKQFSPADHPLCASPESQSNHGTKTTQKWEKSKKPIFGVIFRVKISNISSQSVYPAKCIFYKSA